MPTANERDALHLSAHMTECRCEADRVFPRSLRRRYARMLSGTKACQVPGLCTGVCRSSRRWRIARLRRGKVYVSCICKV